LKKYNTKRIQRKIVILFCNLFSKNIPVACGICWKNTNNNLAEQNKTFTEIFTWLGKEFKWKIQKGEGKVAKYNRLSGYSG
jgi:hypothetical protein